MKMTGLNRLWRCGILLPIGAALLASCSVTGGPLISAAYHGKTDEVARLLDEGRLVDERGGCGLTDAGGDSGATPLFCAAHNGHLDTVKLLLARGADVNAQGGTFKRTPLQAAVFSRHVGVVKLLIEKGADVDDTMARMERFGLKSEVAFLARFVEPPRVGQEPVRGVAPTDTIRPVILSDVDQLPATLARRNTKAYALVIGLENYRQKLPAADFAVSDAQLVTKYLTNVLGYPDENVVTLTDEHATNVDLAKYLEKWLPNQVEPGGTVFVYFSGHGAPNPQTGDAYLVPFDGDPAFIDETGYSLKRLYAALGKLPAAEIVVALDSCFSGAGGRSVIAPGTRSIALNLKAQTPPTGKLTVLAASSGEQTSSTYAEKGHGLFTYFLLKGIRDGDVVAPDGSLRLSALFAYLQPQVERVARREYNNEQTPQWIGAGGR